MTVKGRVISENDDFAEVLILRKSACGESCANCMGGCKQKQHKAKATNSVNAKKGDIVEVYLNDSLSLKMLLTLFILPVILFILAYSVSFTFFNDHFISGFFSAIIFILFFIFLKKFDKKLAPLPEITSIAESGKDGENGA